MPSDFFLSNGGSPRRSDTVWTLAVRWLINVQNNAAAPNSDNDPRRTDSLNRILFKIARALSGG